MSKSVERVAPKRRFPEFRDADEWELVPLNRVGTRRSRKNRDEKIKRVLTNSAELGIVDQRDYFDREIATQGKLESYLVVELGDFVYNPRISASAPVGPISKNTVGTGVMSPLYTVFRVNEAENGFFRHFFSTSGWHAYLRQVSSTGARHDRMAIDTEDFMAMPVPLPRGDTSVNEQKKIADCLNSLDELIAAQARKVDLAKFHRTGLLSTLFPRGGETQPRLRFPQFRDGPAWMAGALSSIFETTSGGTPDRSRPSFWAGGIPWITTSLVDFGVITEAEEFISEEGLKHSSAKILPKGTVLIAMYGQGKTRGQVALLGVEAATNQACAAILPKAGIDQRFVFQSLASRYDELRKLSNSGGQENLSQGLIRALPFAYPENECEQRLIVNCLFALGAFVAAEERKLRALQEHKRGLLQQLFPAALEV